MRIAIIVVLAVVVALATAMGVFVYREQHHSSEVQRLYGLIRRARDAAPVGTDPSRWNFVNEGPYLYVANFMVSRRRCPTGKVTALADQFAARWPQGARSTADVRAMLDLLTAALPEYKDMGWLQDIRDGLKEIDDGPATVGRK